MRLPTAIFGHPQPQLKADYLQAWQRAEEIAKDIQNAEDLLALEICRTDILIAGMKYGGLFDNHSNELYTLIMNKVQQINVGTVRMRREL